MTHYAAVFINYVNLLVLAEIYRAYRLSELCNCHAIHPGKLPHQAGACQIVVCRDKRDAGNTFGKALADQLKAAAALHEAPKQEAYIRLRREQE